ncbi:uncharacterized protein YdaU (DUF1376 family) [Ochrobactrum sp. J50]|uniref:YdaU family protein n=1 Tax=Brucella/Ochrobactrum group TaxID=2826938 RepID=UPI000EFBA0BC|nr:MULTISPECIES: DUF1376 domain-containing protein [Brucella/Ochrobactrum group]MCO7737511.1 DUF1376 domain-containing protein [Brucella intermedia]TWH01428.1 uncharacterized protein YdaU (DUF1376 family) [Ochrobactrum sp. J50]WPM80960.1 DUF1376 domain-containing protein [Brucella pseudintermedia]
MSATPFLQLYVGDYLADTLDLTTEQHGAYLLMLMTMWRHDAKLPNDPSKLARIARVSARRWHLVWGAIGHLFYEQDGFIRNKRLDREYQKAVSISEKRSASGVKGAAVKALKNNDTPQANDSGLLKHSQKSDIIKEEKTPNGVQKKSPKSVLQSVLSEAIAAAVVEHRAKIKKPLTERAAELLAKRLASAKDACGLTPDQAADLMIEKGWLSFEAEWGRNAMQAGWSPEPVVAEKPKPDSELSPEELTAKWTKRMNYARDNRCWFSSAWGPMPGSDGCQVPEQFLQNGDGFDKHGYRWDDQSRRAA